MSDAKSFLAVDLGASSGRCMAGTLADGRLHLEEINRFWNGPTEINGTWYWDFVHLFRHIKEGLGLAARKYGPQLVSMGVDTWGVDFGVLDEKGDLIANPVCYRDPRTEGMFAEAFKRVPKEKIFEQTGLQFMELNSLYQLLAMKLNDAPALKHGKSILFVPDLLNYWLTGKRCAERTFASTTQFYNPVTGNWAVELLEALELPHHLLQEIRSPGEVLGPLSDSVARETGAGPLPVVLTGSHDTASAFAAVPVKEGEHCAFLSSGTWSLFGTELDAPVINPDVLAANFTNEIGVCDTVRFLKNLSGLWVLQELRRNWKEQGFEYGWNEMDRMAMDAAPHQVFIDPGDPVFVAPGDMEKRIQDYCRRTGQAVPETHADVLRAAIEGLALLYAYEYDVLEQLTGRTFEVLRIVGGGCRNILLDQFAADATGRIVVTAPEEATSVGNIVMQMLATGVIGSLAEGREIVRRSFAEESRTFTPQDSIGWQAALKEWTRICRG